MRATAAGEDVVVTVADNGRGVPAAERDDVFRRGTSGLQSDGSGPGPRFVDVLAGQYGGSVEVADSDSGGAAFTVTLRRVEGPA